MNPSYSLARETDRTSQRHMADKTGRWLGFDDVAAAVRRRITVDTRSLALYRIALGFVIVFDLVTRSRSLQTLYTDAGILPRTTVSGYSTWQELSLHMISGSLGIQAALFGVHLAFAVSLLVGYRSNLAAAGCLMLYISLYLRNPYVINHGDVLLMLILLWTMYLPVSERWSVDVTRASVEASGETAGLASAALLLTVVTVYLQNAYFKLSSDTWLQGESVEYALQRDSYTTLVGEHLAGYPELLTAATYLWLTLLSLGFLLIISTGWLRLAFTAAFAAFHFGMSVTITLAVFPLVSIAALLPFLPPELWNALERRTPEDVAHTLETPTRYISRLFKQGSSIEEPGRSNENPRDRRWRTHRGWRTLCTMTLVLAFTVIFSLHAAAFAPSPASDSDSVPAADTAIQWSLFVDPSSPERHVRAEATLMDGETVEVNHGLEVDAEPPLPDSSVNDARWRTYSFDMVATENTHLQRAYAEHVCRHGEHAEDLQMIEIHRVLEYHDVDGESFTVEIELLQYSCR